MAQKKGHTGNPNGRPKGTPNRTTKEARELLEVILFGEVDNIKSALDSIRKDSEYRYIDSINKLFTYVLPKKTDITSGNEILKQVVNITVTDPETKDLITKLDANK